MIQDNSDIALCSHSNQANHLQVRGSPICAALPVRVTIAGTDPGIVFAEGGVEIGADCWIGMGVRILPAARLGDGCVVGAGRRRRHPARPIRSR